MQIEQDERVRVMRPFFFNPERATTAVISICFCRHSPEGVIKDAKARQIPIVTAQWIVQSLVHGRYQKTAPYAYTE